jgi:hypothetical protein
MKNWQRRLNMISKSYPTLSPAIGALKPLLMPIKRLVSFGSRMFYGGLDGAFK